MTPTTNQGAGHGATPAIECPPASAYNDFDLVELYQQISGRVSRYNTECLIERMFELRAEIVKRLASSATLSADLTAAQARVRELEVELAANDDSWKAMLKRAEQAEQRLTVEGEAVAMLSSEVIDADRSRADLTAATARADALQAEVDKLSAFYNEIVLSVGHDRIVKEYYQRGELLRDEARLRKEAEATLRAREQRIEEAELEAKCSALWAAHMKLAMGTLRSKVSDFIWGVTLTPWKTKELRVTGFKAEFDAMCDALKVADPEPPTLEQMRLTLAALATDPNAQEAGKPL